MEEFLIATAVDNGGKSSVTGNDIHLQDGGRLVGRRHLVDNENLINSLFRIFLSCHCSKAIVWTIPSKICSLSFVQAIAALSKIPDPLF